MGTVQLRECIINFISVPSCLRLTGSWMCLSASATVQTAELLIPPRGLQAVTNYVFMGKVGDGDLDQNVPEEDDRRQLVMKDVEVLNSEKFFVNQFIEISLIRPATGDFQDWRHLSNSLPFPHSYLYVRKGQKASRHRHTVPVAVTPTPKTGNCKQMLGSPQ